MTSVTAPVADRAMTPQDEIIGEMTKVTLTNIKRDAG